MSDSDNDEARAASPLGSAPEDQDTPSAPADNAEEDMKDSDGDMSDLESELSEVDETEFANFNPDALERPVEIDEEAARSLIAAKRKRTDKDGQQKKPKEARRQKKRRGDDDDSGADGEILEGKRKSKPKSVRIEGEKKERDRAKERKREEQRQEIENEENLTPDERRRRALDKAMDNALKNPNKRRRKKDEVVWLAHWSLYHDTDFHRTSKKHLMRRLQLSKFAWSKLVRPITQLVSVNSQLFIN
jgi:transcription factor SPN1